jgi:hypothetical protein
MKRHALIARIHIAKSRAQLCSICGRVVFGSYCPACKTEDLQPFTDERYRRILMAAGGYPSCSQIGDQGLMKVMEVFDRAGFAEAYPYISPEKEQANQKRRVIRHIEIRAPSVLGNSWEARLGGFIRKNFDKASLHFCTPEELRKVIGWINRTAKYESNKQGRYQR